MSSLIKQIPNSFAIQISRFDVPSKVKVDARDANATCYLGHTNEELMYPGGTGGQINGVRVTNAQSPVEVDWYGELWARSDADYRNVAFSW